MYTLDYKPYSAWPQARRRYLVAIIVQPGHIRLPSIFKTDLDFTSFVLKSFHVRFEHPCNDLATRAALMCSHIDVPYGYMMLPAAVSFCCIKAVPSAVSMIPDLVSKVETHRTNGLGKNFIRSYGGHFRFR
jgi:hypothetical protein